jgi:hypothetical protein
MGPADVRYKKFELVTSPVKGRLRVAIGVAVLCLALPSLVRTPEASANQTLSSVDTAIRTACIHPPGPHAGTVPGDALFLFERSNIGAYPPLYGAGSDLALFSRGATLYDCVAGFTHISAAGVNIGVASSTPHLTSRDPLAGIVGIVRGGFAANRDNDTDTLWVTGVMAPSIKRVEVRAYRAGCFGPMKCLALAIPAGSTTAVIHGRYFLASLVVAHSVTTARIGLLVIGFTATSTAGAEVIAGRLAPPATNAPMMSGFS